eukprot:4298984-Alexandrium_andersonii.AAC.1
MRTNHHGESKSKGGRIRALRKRKVGGTARRTRAETAAPLALSPRDPKQNPNGVSPLNCKSRGQLTGNNRDRHNRVTSGLRM